MDDLHIWDIKVTNNDCNHREVVPRNSSCAFFVCHLRHCGRDICSCNQNDCPKKIKDEEK